MTALNIANLLEACLQVKVAITIDDYNKDKRIFSFNPNLELGHKMRTTHWIYYLDDCEDVPSLVINDINIYLEN